jgi:hypothetical protein
MISGAVRERLKSVILRAKSQFSWLVVFSAPGQKKNRDSDWRTDGHIFTEQVYLVLKYALEYYTIKPI